jgi:hypothetical protein
VPPSSAHALVSSGTCAPNWQTRSDYWGRAIERGFHGVAAAAAAERNPIPDRRVTNSGSFTGEGGRFRGAHSFALSPGWCGMVVLVRMRV